MLNLAHENIPSTSLYRGLRGCNGGEKHREQFVIIPHAMHKFVNTQRIPNLLALDTTFADRFISPVYDRAVHMRLRDPSYGVPFESCEWNAHDGRVI